MTAKNHLKMNPESRRAHIKIQQSLKESPNEYTTAPLKTNKSEKMQRYQGWPNIYLCSPSTWLIGRSWPKKGPYGSTHPNPHCPNWRPHSLLGPGPRNQDQSSHCWSNPQPGLEDLCHADILESPNTNDLSVVHQHPLPTRAS